MCSRQFKTLQALEQHAASSHSKAGGSPNRNKSPQLGGKSSTQKNGGGSSSRPTQSGGKNNLMLGEILRIIGRTPDAREMLSRVLHPNDERPSGGVRICDETTAMTAAPELRVRSTISAPSGLTAGATWDMNVYVFNSPDVPCYFERVASGTAMKGPNTADALATRQDNHNLVFPSASPAQFIQSGAEKGNLYANSSIHGYTDQVRAVYKGITAHLNSSSLANQGMIYGGQWGATLRESTYNGGGADSVVQQALIVPPFPTTPDELFAKVPSTDTWQAKKGGYMVSTWNQPTNLMQATDQDYILLYHNGTTTLPLYGDLIGGGAETAYLLGTACQDNMSFGVMMFRGLDKSANVELKIKQGVEAVPALNSPWAPFAESSPLLDRSVLATVSKVQQMMQNMYPADFNDFSGILSTVGSMIKGLAPTVTGVANSVGDMGIPVVSTIAKGIGKVGGWLGDLFGI